MNQDNSENIENGDIEKNQRSSNPVQNVPLNNANSIENISSSIKLNDDNESLESQLLQFPDYESLDPQIKDHLGQFLSNWNNHWAQEKKTLLKMIKDRNDEKSNIINELNILKPYLEKVSRQRNDYYNELVALRDENNIIKSTDDEMNQTISSLEKKVDTLSKELANERNKSLEYERTSKLSSQKEETTILSLKDQIKLNEHEIERLNQSLNSLNEQNHIHLKEIKDLKAIIKKNKDQYENDSILQQKITSSQEEQIHSLNLQLTRYQRLESDFKKVDNLIQNNHSLKQENTRLLNILNSNSVARLYTQELEQLKKDLEYTNSVKNDLESQLESYIKDLESQLPTIENFKTEIKSLNHELTESKLLIENKTQELAAKEIQLLEGNNHIIELSNQINTLKRTNTDLAHQLQYILISTSILDNTNSPVLSEKQLIFLKQLISKTNDRSIKNQDDIDITDSQQIISEQLVKFKNIVELQKMNMKLVNTVRSLSDKLESIEEEKEAHKDNLQIINDAKSALLKLQNYTDELELKVKDLNQQIKSHMDTIERQDTEKQQLKMDLTKLQHFELVQKELQNTINNNLKRINSLNEKVKKLEVRNDELILKNKKSESSNMLLQDRIKILEHLLEVAKQENSDNKVRVQNLNSLLLRAENEVIDSKREHSDCDRIENSLRHDINEKTMMIKKLNLSIDMMKQREEKSKETINSYEAELISLKCKMSNNDLEIAKLTQEKDQLELLNRELIEEFNVQHSLNSHRISNDNNNLKWYQKNIDLLKVEKQQLKQSINEKVDVITKLEGSINNLKEDIKKLELSIEMKERLSKEEIVTLNQKISKYRQNETSLTNDLNSLKQWKSEHESQLNESNNKLSEMENDYKQKIIALNNELHTKDRELSSLQTTNDNLLQIQNDIEAKNNSLLSNITDLSKKKEDLLNKIESNKLEKDLLEQKVIDLERSYNEEVSKNDLSTKEKAELKNEIEEYKSKLEKLQHTVEESSRILTQRETDWKQQEAKYQREISQQSSKLSILNSMNQNNEHAPEQGNNVNKYIDTATFTKLVEEKEKLWNQLVSSQHEEVLLRNTLAETREQLRLFSSEMEKANEINGSEPQSPKIDTEQLTSQIEKYKQKSLDSEDRFNRLKKQAHEKLDHSKGVINSLTLEVSKLKTLNSELEDNLKASDLKINQLESIVKKGESDKLTINNLQKELTTVLEGSKDLETKLNENTRISDNMKKELNQKIQSLNTELDKLREETHLSKMHNISNTVESMKKTFEEEKIQFMNNIKREYEDKLAEMKKFTPESSSYEKAKEKVEMDLKNSYMKSPETKLDTLKNNTGEEELQKIRNKAFEEGKQQYLMKVTLLERKISKLESQLKEKLSTKGEKETPSHSATIAKTPEAVKVNKSSPFVQDANNSANNNNNINNSTFPLSFQSSSSSNNPFISPLNKSTFMSPAGDNPSVTKPTFSLQLKNRNVSDMDTSEITTNNSSDEGKNNNNSLKRPSIDEPSLDNVTSKKIKENNKEEGIEGTISEKKDEENI